MEAGLVRLGVDLTLAEVSNLIHKNPEWIGRQLSLLSLRRDIQKIVERGEIPLGSAYLLAKLPMVEQAQLVELARTAPTREFAPVVTRLLKQIQEAARQGKLHDYCKDFEPVAYLRPLKEVLAEYKAHGLGGLAVTQAGGQTPVDGWYLALRWALNLDEESVRQQREKVLARTSAAVLERRVEPCDGNE